jgi:phage baseplate assembly protein gpV
MGHKNILADTDFADGRDQRFVHSILIGKVSDIVCTDKGANVRVIMPDKLDHDDQPLITKPIPVLQVSAGGKKSFAMPRIGQNTLLVKLPNSTSSYAAIGFFYTSKDPPPVTDPRLDYCIYDDGSSIKIDSNDGASVTLTWDFKGGISITTQKDIAINAQGGAKVTVTAEGDITLNSTGGKAVITASEIDLNGTIVHEGSMTTSGIHTAADGPHAACGAGERLEQQNIAQRIAALEQRVIELEQQRGGGA